ncbi:MAG: K(+)-transporting ATPase subunit F [Rhodopseudomonas palustris]|nr:K(+)-transporting ATPase subunit F [Rhodopseudomonas palustris]
MSLDLALAAAVAGALLGYLVYALLRPEILGMRDESL